MDADRDRHDVRAALGMGRTHAIVAIFAEDRDPTVDLLAADFTAEGK